MRVLVLLLGFIALAAGAVVFLGGGADHDGGQLPHRGADESLVPGGTNGATTALGATGSAEGRRALGTSAGEDGSSLLEGPTVRVVLLVDVAETFARDARTLPEIAFVAGVATGKDAVARGLDAPEAGDASVASEWVARRGRTGEDGSCRLPLDLPETWFLQREPEDLWLWGHLVQPGHQQRIRLAPLPPEIGVDGGEAHLRLQARRGATVRGHVRRADGGPGESTRLRLLIHADGDLDTEDWATAGPSGAFRMHTDRPGTFALHAMHAQQGSAFRDDLVIQAGDPPRDVELTLRGSGVLAGVLRDPRGAPVRLHRLWALPADHGGTGLHDSTRLAQVRGDGLMDAQCLTDEEGRFRLTGLREGLYVIRAHDGVELEFPEVLTPDPVPTGTEDLELVHARHVLLVRVLDHGGTPLVPRVLPPWDPSIQGELSVYCARATPEGRLDADHAWREVHATTSPGGAVAFHLEPDVPYVFGVLSPEHPLVEQTVLLPPDAYEDLREVRLPPPAPPATLDLTILRPDGEPFVEHVNVSVRSATTGCPVQVSGEYDEGPYFRAKLPAGSWRVHVDAEPPRGHHGEIFDATPFAPAETLVVLRAGEVLPVDLRLGASGRLEVWFELPPGWTSGERVPGGDEGEGGEDWLEPFRRSIGGARVELRRPTEEGGSEVVRPVFDLTYVRNLELPAHLGAVITSWIPPGIPMGSMNPLPVGTWTVRLEAPGCVPLEREVQIEAGAVCRVEAALELVQTPEGR